MDLPAQQRRQNVPQIPGNTGEFQLECGKPLNVVHLNSFLP